MSFSCVGFGAATNNFFTSRTRELKTSLVGDGSNPKLEMRSAISGDDNERELMDLPQTYAGILDYIRGDSVAVEREKSRLDGLIDGLSSQIRARITRSTAPALVWCLGLEEIKRASNLAEMHVSDFAGHARFLRALTAGVRFASANSSDFPKLDELLALCAKLWNAMLHREMIDGLKDPDADTVDRKRNFIASTASLLNAVQGELMYSDQAEERARRLFGPFSKDIIESSLGVSVDEIVAGLNAARRLVPTRIENAVALSETMRELQDEYFELAETGVSKAELDQFVLSHPRYHEAGVNLQKSHEEWYLYLQFQPSDFEPLLNGKAKLFLDAFSFCPGEVNKTLATPFDDDEVRRRPFARIGDDRYLLMDPCYCSFAALYRLVECFDDERKLQRLNKHRDKSLEQEAEKLFQTPIGQPDAVFRSYYLPVGVNGDFAERDLLIMHQDCLFLIESKARPLRQTKGRRDKLATILSDVKRSIQGGYDQACDVISHIREAACGVLLFDSKRRQIGEIDPKKIRHFVPIVFLDSYYGLIAADLQPWIALDRTIGFPWVVDRDTMESITLKIDSFQRLKAFLLWRRELHGIAINEDEAVFAGFFFRHGPCEMPHGAKLVQLHPDYADVFEVEHFKRKGIDIPIRDEGGHPPVWSSMKRRGDDIEFRIAGKLHDSINIKTGENRRRRDRPRSGTGRNDPCPCGSGKKFKKCCRR